MKKHPFKNTIAFLCVLLLTIVMIYFITNENPQIKNEVTVQYLVDGELVTEVLPTKYQWEQRLKELDATNTKYWVSVN